MTANLTEAPTQRDMRVLVRHSVTGRYLTQNAQWTGQEEAFDFQSFTQVLAICNLHQITDCEIHYQFPESSYNFSIEWKRDANNILRNNQPDRRSHCDSVTILTITQWWKEGSRDEACKGKRFSIEGVTTVDDFNFCVGLAREFGYHLAFVRHTAAFSRPSLTPSGSHFGVEPSRLINQQ